MNDTHKFNNDPFRKIIDPKSGFSLYLKNFKDSSIYHVSTEKTFPIPSDNITNNNQNSSNKLNLELKKEIETLKQNQKELKKYSSSTIASISKTNQQLMYLIYGVVGLFIFSVLF